MPTTGRDFGLRFGLVLGSVLLLAIALPAQPEPPKKSAEPPAKSSPKSPLSPGIKLPDGTTLWTGPTAGDGERVVITPEELQKLLDQVDQLKKQLANRRPASPSGCAVRARIEKRGETLLATLSVTYTFHTSAANAAVQLGGKRAFLVSAALDGNKVAVLDGGEDGLVALIDAPGDHTLVAEFETSITTRGTKPEIGFEIGLPRSAITTLRLDAPPDVKRVNLTTRTSDGIKPPESRRVAALDVKQLGPRPGQDAGYAMGPIDLVELTWEPPATTGPMLDVGQTAEVDVICVLTESTVESTAKYRLRGTAREWRIVSPAELLPERVVTGTDVGASQSPIITKPTDPEKPVWKVEFPIGVSPSDWAFTAVSRIDRPKADDPRHKGPFSVGPCAVLAVSRQTGTIRVTAAGNTRLTFQHGPDLRRTELPPGTPDDLSAAYFRLAPGPVVAVPAFQPLLKIEAEPLRGDIRVRPTYKLRLTEAGWQMRAELRVTPIRREVDNVLIEVPASWPRSIQADPPELVAGVQQEDPRANAPRRSLTIRLASGQRQPFDLILSTTLGIPVANREASIPLPRYPDSGESETQVVATVPAGLELRGTTHEWENNVPATWAMPLNAAPNADGKSLKPITTVQGKFDRGLARIDLNWQPYRPELTADMRVEATITDRQIVVSQQIKLRSPDGFSKPVRFRAPTTLTGLALDPISPGEWSFSPPTEVRETSLMLSYAIPLPPRPARLAVPVVWPLGTTRTETTLRIWVISASGREISAEPGSWRELPPEPVADRDILPAATLTASGAELPLWIEVRDSTDSSAATVWIERGYFQCAAAEDGTVACRARYLLRRWLTDSIELRVPSAAVGTPEILLEDPPRRVPITAVTDPAGGQERIYTVPLPAAKPGRVVMLEIRYQLPGLRPGEEIAPPYLKAALSGPIRWHITGPSGTIPLVFGSGFTVEQRWRLRSWLPVPVPFATADELDRWIRTGAEPEPTNEDDSRSWGGGATVLRSRRVEPLQIYRVPGAVLMVACSVALLVIGLLLARLPKILTGPVVALLGGAIAAGAILYPQPASQFASSALPGLIVLALALAVQAVARRYYRRKVTYLPGFSRTRPDAQPPISVANESTGALSQQSASSREPRVQSSGT